MGRGKREHGVDVVERIEATLVVELGRPQVGDALEARAEIDPVEMEPP